MGRWSSRFTIIKKLTRQRGQFEGEKNINSDNDLKRLTGNNQLPVKPLLFFFQSVLAIFKRSSCTWLQNVGRPGRQAGKGRKGVNAKPYHQLGAEVTTVFDVEKGFFYAQMKERKDTVQ